MNFLDKFKMAGQIQNNVEKMQNLINSLCPECKPKFITMLGLLYKTKGTKLDLLQFCPNCKEKIKVLQKPK
jgi:hypothetical protein